MLDEPDYPDRVTSIGDEHLIAQRTATSGHIIWTSAALLYYCRLDDIV